MIIITQQCDRCKRTRELRGVDDADNGGWRNVSVSSRERPQRTDKHLCNDCLKAVLEEVVT